MPVRCLKVVLVAFVSLLALVYATQNLMNLDEAYAAVAYALGRQDQVVYPNSLFPGITAPLLIWGALAVIVLAEYAAGLCAARGAWDLWRARRAPAPEFQQAKTFALLGAGLGVVVWFGLFGALGGAVFQMWQTQAGALSLEGAFQFAGSCALVLIFVNQVDQ